MNQIDECYRMLKQASQQQQKLAKIRGKLCGRNEEDRAWILKMEQHLSEYRDMLRTHIAANVGQLLMFSEDKPIPRK